jgi:hypothetical protein
MALALPNPYMPGDLAWVSLPRDRFSLPERKSWDYG